MSQMVYDLIEPAVMNDYVRAYDQERLRPENAFALAKYLPDLLTEDLEFKIRKGALNDVDIAEYRAFDTPSPMTDRPGTQMISGSLGPISRQIPLGEEEILRTRALEANTNDPLIAAILDDAERMTRAVASRIELARGDIIDDGKVTIAENGLVLEADFLRPGSMRKVATTDWTDPTAEAMEDLTGWHEDYTDLNGFDAAETLMPTKMIGLLLRNEEVRTYAANNGTVPNRVSRATLNSILEQEGVPPISTYDVKVRKDGVSTRVLPENKLYFMPPEAAGRTHYGVTAEAIKLRAKGLITKEQAPGIVAVILESDHPVQTSTNAVALAVPALGRSEWILDAEVF